MDTEWLLDPFDVSFCCSVLCRKSFFRFMNFIFMVAPDNRFLGNDEGVVELDLPSALDLFPAIGGALWGDLDGATFWPGVLTASSGLSLPGFHILERRLPVKLNTSN